MGVFLGSEGSHLVALANLLLGSSAGSSLDQALKLCMVLGLVVTNMLQMIVLGLVWVRVHRRARSDDTVVQHSLGELQLICDVGILCLNGLVVGRIGRHCEQMVQMVAVKQPQLETVSLAP